MNVNLFLFIIIIIRKIRRLDDFGKYGTGRRELPNRQNIQKKEKSALTMKDMIYYNPKTSPMSIPKKALSNTSEIIIKTENMKTERERSPEPSLQPQITAPLVPQLKLGPNGEMILDEKSLVVENAAEKEARKAIERSEIIYDDGSSGTYGIFKRQKRTKDWTADETIKFYRCLHTIGTDFSLMLQLFPNRSRRDLKIKFKKEERTNGHLIDKALRNPKEFDIESLQKEFDKEDAEKEEKSRQEQEERKAQREELRKRRNNEVQNIKKSNPQKWLSRTSRTMTNVNDVYDVVDANAIKKPPPANTFKVVPKSIFTISYVPETIQENEVNIDEEDVKPFLDTNINTVDIVSQDEEQENIIVDDESQNQIDMDEIDWDSLVLCTAQEPETGNVTYGVYLKDPTTGELSKEPLDLPSEVVEILKQNYEENG